MKEEVKIIAAVGEVFSYRKANPKSTKEEVMRHISKFIGHEKNEKVKIGMVASSSKALDILEREPSLTEKEVMKRIMQNMSNFVSAMNERD